MRKVIASTTVAASLIGGAAGALAFGPALAGAQTETPTEESATNDDSSGAEVSRLRDWAGNAIAGLVEDDTLTQAQADAVLDALDAARPDDIRGGFGGRGPGGRTGGALAESLGLDPDEVSEALRDGQTLAEILDDNGLTTDDAVDAIVESLTERLDAAVESGRLSEDRAAELSEEITERAESIVSGEAPLLDRSGRRGSFGERGPFGQRGPLGSMSDSQDGPDA